MRQGGGIDNGRGDVVWSAYGRGDCDLGEGWLYFGCHKDIFDQGASMQSVISWSNHGNTERATLRYQAGLASSFIAANANANCRRIMA